MARLAVVLVDRLEEAQARRAAPRRLDLAGEEKGVAAVEKPAVGGIDRDPGVARRMAGERDHRDLGVEVGEEPDALETEPAVPAGAVLDPDRAWTPLLADVARALRQRRRPRRGKLGREDVDLRLREVADTAGVVEVEMGREDVPDVGRVVAQRFDLPDRALALLADRGDHRAEGQAEALRMGAVPATEAGAE